MKRFALAILVTMIVSAVGPFVPAATSTANAAGVCDAIEDRFEPQPDVPWYPGASQGYRVIRVWNNRPNNDQQEFKLLLTPGEDIGIMGGGSSWTYHKDCAKEAQRDFNNVNLPPITISQLFELGLLVVDGQFCPTDPVMAGQPPTGGSWIPGGYIWNWKIVHFWTNLPGFNQSERKLLLEPGQAPKLLGGGSVFEMQYFCGEPMRRRFATETFLPTVTLDQLRAEGLVEN